MDGDPLPNPFSTRRSSTRVAGPLHNESGTTLEDLVDAPANEMGDVIRTYTTLPKRSREALRDIGYKFRMLLRHGENPDLSNDELMNILNTGLVSLDVVTGGSTTGLRNKALSSVKKSGGDINMNNLVPYRRHNTKRLLLGGFTDALGEAGEWIGDNPQTFGTILGGIGGAAVGNPMLGAKLGGMAGGVASQATNQQGDSRQRARRVLARRRRSASPSYAGSSGSFTMADGGAMRVSGRSHEQGGIRLPGNVEIEGGETVGSVGGQPHAFSKRLKVPGTDMTFADVHQQLARRGAGEDEITQLANLQSQVAGRGDMSGPNRLDEGGKYYAIKASETSGDDPKYPINSADDVRDAWKLRSHGDYNISQEKLEQRIKRKAREYDVDLPTDGGEKQGGGPLHNLPGNRRRGLSDHNLSTESATPTTVSTSSPQGFQPTGDSFSILPPGLRADFPSTLSALLRDTPGSGLESTDPISGAGPERIPTRTVDELISGSGEGISGGISDPSFSLTGPGGVDFGSASQQAETSSTNSALDTVDKVLPFVPGVINAARGLLGDAEGMDIPRANISDRSIDAARNMDTDFNVQPQIAAANQAFRSIVASPNVSQARKQAAFSDLMQQRAQTRAQEENKETQLENQRQDLISRLMSRSDRSEAQFNQEANIREAISQQRAEAARQNLIGSGVTQMVRARQRQRTRQQGMNRNVMAVLASMAGAPQTVREDVLNSILPLIENDKVRSSLQGSISGK